jgi:hypothetical protein
VNRYLIAFALVVTYPLFAQAEQLGIHVGEAFIKARAKLYAAGWHADPLVHASGDEYMGLDRALIQGGYAEVDYCSVGKSFCVLQYTRGKECLRLHTQGEQLQAMKVEGWSSECSERGAIEGSALLPADVRYAAQWRNDCENFGQCEGEDAFLLNLKKKYARDPAVMKVLESYGNPAKANPGTEK